MIASFFSGIHAFFHSLLWDVIEALLVLFVVACWAGTIFWARKDARRRIADQRLVQLATVAAALPPFLGPLVYMLFRPPEYLEDVRERELEIQAIRGQIGGGTCPVCESPVDAEFLVCPVCTTRLRDACSSCERPLEAAWQVCPYCETPVTLDDPVPLHPEASAPAAARRTAPARRSRSPR